MRLAEIMLHKFNDQQLLDFAGQGAPSGHLRSAGREKFEEFPARDGLTVRRYPRYGKFFLMQGDTPLVSMSSWGPGERLIGPIGSLIVADEARGKGFGKLLYRTLLDNGFQIISGDNHTQHSRMLWIWLASQPDLEITFEGHPVRLENGELASEVPIYGHRGRLLVRKR